MTLPRLRQAVVVARDLAGTCRQLEEAFGLRAPYHDPGVGEFGLANAVYEVGDCFLEVVSPVRDDTTAGRYLAKNGDDGGYMAIFQVDDVGAARDRIDSLGLRVVWKVDLDDIAGTHVHPKDLAGAIVSIDEARPAESWRWAGPRWTGGAPRDATAGGIEEIVVAVDDVDTVAERWSTVIGGLPSVRFVPASQAGNGLVEIVLDLPSAPQRAVSIGAVVRSI